jgi:hypothetical protein
VEGLDPDGEEAARRFAVGAYIDDAGLVLAHSEIYRILF